MALTRPQQVDDLLLKVAEWLDIPDHLAEQAILQYEDVATWLAAPGSPLHPYDPEIYAQGSFRLGTVVRPLLSNDEYDIDLVCLLDMEKESTTQEGLKNLVGDRLKARHDIKQRLEEHRRCWRLDYPRQFHLDVLPVIPNPERRPTGILLTDTDLVRWQKSNPVAYADWFRERMEPIFEEKRAALAQSLRASIEEVPDWQVRTPLQRVVQLLKRHRDVYFQEDCDDKPVSIIITTLAGHAYEGQADLGDALLGMLGRMRGLIQNRAGKWCVANPVDPDENFADKWNETPARREKFFAWLRQAEGDFATALGSRSLSEAAQRLGPVLGDTSLALAATSLGIPHDTVTAVKSLGATDVPELDSTAHRQSPPWPVVSLHRARLRSGVYGAVGGTKKLWDLTDRTVPKRLGLRFQLETNAPRPYEVWWQVVNTGREAAAARQLRGGFQKADAQDGDVHWESTLYTGTHTIEAFVVKDGTCVARTGVRRVRIRP
jgi:hypothetical protein